MKSTNRTQQDVTPMAILGDDVSEEVKTKKKSSRKISAPQWLKRGRFVGGKSKADKSVPAPCCGVEVSEENAGLAVGGLDERQFQDKSVQCDDWPPEAPGHRFDVHRNRSDECACCCHPVNPIYQTNLIVNQIPYMDDELGDASLPTFRRSHNLIRHRRSARVDSLIPDALPPPALFRKNNLFAGVDQGRDGSDLRPRSNTFSYSSAREDCRPQSHTVSIPNSIECDRSVPAAATRPRVPQRRRTGAVYGNVALNVHISNAMDTVSEVDDAVEVPVPSRRRCGVAQGRPNPQDLAADQAPQSSCLVLGMNSDARNPLNYKMYTPFYNKRQTMPAEHFRNWPQDTRYDDENDYNRRALSFYSEVSNQLEQYERRSFDAGSSSVLNAIDSNSILYRSNSDGLHKDDPSPGEKNRRVSIMSREVNIERDDHAAFPGGKTPAIRVHSSRRKSSVLLRAKNKPNADRQTPNLLAVPPTATTTSTFGRWSGSIQNLFSIGHRTPNGAGRVGGWSKSENCLNEVGQQRQQQRAPKSDRLWSDRLFGRHSTAAGRAKNGRPRRTNTFLTSGGGSFFTYRYDDEEESVWQKYFSLGMLRKIRPKQAKPGSSKDPE